MTHRLDANTTGIVVFARKRKAAQQVQNQFENSSVKKTYLARVLGHPEDESFTCHAKIAGRPGQGGLRLIDEEEGLEASTDFKLLNQYDDGTALIECTPLTGRTNQIRIHLWSLGLPIVNDPSYLPNQELGTNQTLPLGTPPMCLHAAKLELKHPTSDEQLELKAPVPEWADGFDSDQG